jgi:hypothetical protein
MVKIILVPNKRYYLLPPCHSPLPYEGYEDEYEVDIMRDHLNLSQSQGVEEESDSQLNNEKTHLNPENATQSENEDEEYDRVDLKGRVVRECLSASLDSTLLDVIRRA